MVTTEHITTAEQLLQAGDLGPCELIQGELIMMTPPGFRHEAISLRIAARLWCFVEEHRLGIVLSGDPGFHIASEPDTVRCPDVAFLRAERVPESIPDGYFRGPPDLAVEILSPSDRPRDVAEKVGEWLRAGCLAVWLVDPKEKTVKVHRPAAESVALRAGDVLDGGELLPGLRLPLSDIFLA